MIKPIVKDVFSLGQKSDPAAPGDVQTGQDLQDTLKANESRCVGMAANMIGVKKRIIIVNIGFMNLVMYNPVIVKKDTSYETEEGCLSLEGVRKTTRYQNIEVEYMDSNWKKQKSHQLTVVKAGDLLTMDFPAVPPVPYVYEDYMGAGLGAVPTEVLRTERDLMLVYESDEIIRTMKPDFSKLKEFPIGLSVYVTARSSDPAYDIAARAFWPKLNIDEDPVCGSMHTTLVPYWSRILSKDRIISRQLSARGGTLYCELCGDRVKLSGKCQLYLSGEIDLCEKDL